MGEMIPFITVDGALEAIEFYKDVFNATLQEGMTMLQNVPGYDKPQYAGKVGHSTLLIGSSRIFLNDSLEEQPIVRGDHIQLVLDLESEENLRNAFETLAKEGNIVQKLHEVFWGALFGTVKDKYGVTWQIYYGHK
ncbi:VOC family protein [Candidatus Izimaplasma bacterium]|nr:VOC family protein [Candidatus Izimaplasma bacterium]